MPHRSLARLFRVLVPCALLLLTAPAAFAGGPIADLSITKDDGGTTSVPGMMVVYTIVASNAGPSAVTGATVTDTFVASLTCTWTCTASAGSSCTGSGSGDISDSVDLISGGTATYTATCAIASSATGSLVNTASISSSTPDPNSGNNSATDTNTLVPDADLSVAKVDSADPVDQGAAYSYTLTVSNAGPSDAAGVVATDTLPAGVTFVSTSGCAEDPNGVPTCTLGAIAAGGSAAYTVNVTAPSASGTVTNTVSVAASTADSNAGNDSTTEDTTVNPEADVSVTKDDGSTTSVPGTTVVYTIVASNAGPDDVTGATLTDVFAPELTCTWACTASAGSSCAASGTGDISDTAVDLLSGGTATYTATCQIASSATGSLINTATMNSPVNDPDTGNDVATDTNTLVPDADLSVVKVDSADPVNQGAAYSYTLTVSNAGPSDAAGVVATETLPAGVTFVSTSGCAEDPNGVPTCTLGAIVAGGSAAYTVNVTAPSASGTVTNAVSVAASTADSNAGNNSATEDTTVNPEADLSITKDDGSATSVPGTEVVYMIVASNAGPDDVTGATVTDTFAPELTCTWTCTASAGSSCTASGTGDINDAAVDLLSGGTATYTATCQIDSAATGSLVNTASISSAINDPNTANDSATDTNTLEPAADLSVSSFVTPDPIFAGGPFSFVVTVQNDGPSDAVGAAVTSAIPGLTLDGTVGCAEDPNGLPTCTLGDIPAGQSVSFDVNGSAPDTQTTVSVSFTVSSSTTDPVPGNDAADVEVVIDGVAVDIPTASTVGLALLGLLLGLLAILRLRQLS